MQIKIDKALKHPVPEGMIGLFFEDINYAADGGLYAEMIENRSFEFVKAGGDVGDYYVEYDGGYGWHGYPTEDAASLRLVTGSPLSEENPHYMRVTAKQAGAGLSNKAYEGLVLTEGEEYEVTLWARKVRYEGDFKVLAVKDGQICGEVLVTEEHCVEQTYNFFHMYKVVLTASKSVHGAEFVLTLTEPGIAEFDFLSMFPKDAVAGLFRKDLFERLKELKPGFLRFPGGCIVEGNTYNNRYRYKNTLKQPWARKSNWNRWAVHGTNKDNGFETQYSHYNQTYGLGFYEYFLLCELIGAKPLPVLNVGLACQYQSKEKVDRSSPEFLEAVQDALDLIEFANGDTDTKWGGVRMALGHPEPFGLEILGIGNEQWQTEEVDFFERYEAFERIVHANAPEIKLIGSAGPDITSERYTAAWDFYRTKLGQLVKEDPKAAENFVYSIDEHYYVPPKWLFDHVDFYDNYARDIKIFSGEYAAHPASGMNMPEANTLEGALAEAAFMTGLERNCDLVILASYAPLFARVNYAQWSPDMIWFDGATSYVSPSYYVQKMYGQNMADYTLETYGQEKELAKEQVYYSVSYLEGSDEVVLKIVNGSDCDHQVQFELDATWSDKEDYAMELLTYENPKLGNTIDAPERVKPVLLSGKIAEGICLPAGSFAVVKI